MKSSEASYSATTGIGNVLVPISIECYTLSCYISMDKPPEGTTISKDPSKATAVNPEGITWMIPPATGPTTFYALFCTAQASAPAVNKLLQLADADETVGNLWSLIRNHSQKRADKPSDFPVEEFHTSFEVFSLEDLGAFCREKFGEDRNPAGQRPISDQDFAIIDQRSLEDDTVVLVKDDSWVERIDLSDPSTDDYNLRDMEGLRPYRVEMKEATSIMDGIRYFHIAQSIPDEDGVHRFGTGKKSSGG